MNKYIHYWGFIKEPFSQTIKTEDLYPLLLQEATVERIQYTLRLGAVCIITGDIGAGKSTL